MAQKPRIVVGNVAEQGEGQGLQVSHDTGHGVIHGLVLEGEEGAI